MSTDIDWQHELDSSFGAGHDVPPGHYVAAGRTAVRRRRATAAVLAAAVVIGGGTAWASGQGSAVRGDAPVATTRADSEQREVTLPDDGPERLDKRMKQLDRMRAQPWVDGEAPARTFPDGIQIRKGAVVHERRDDLYPGKDTRSAALDLSYDDVRWWVLLEWDAGGSTMASERSTDGWHSSFDAFVAASTAGGGMTHEPTEPVDDEYPYADLVDFDAGELTVRPGAIVVRRVDNPMDVAAPATSIGLVVELDGETTWLRITSDRNGSSSTSEKAAESGWLTFDQWLAADVALQTRQPGLELVTIRDGRMTPTTPGVEILDQRADPDVPSYLDPTTTGSGLAMVDWKGERWFVLVVEFTGSDSVTTFAAEKAGGADTIDEFIAFTESRADRGGLR